MHNKIIASRLRLNSYEGRSYKKLDKGVAREKS